jgi:hypothetical protein
MKIGDLPPPCRRLIAPDSGGIVAIGENSTNGNYACWTQPLLREAGGELLASPAYWALIRSAVLEEV